MRGRIAATGLLVLVLLHLDFWRTAGATLLFGWLPEELAYRVGHVLLAWVYVAWISGSARSAEESER